MPTGKQKRENQFQLFGWLFFLVCSFFFIANSVAAGSPLGLTGSVLFLLGCIIFLIPLTWKRG